MKMKKIIVLIIITLSTLGKLQAQSYDSLIGPKYENTTSLTTFNNSLYWVSYDSIQIYLHKVLLDSVHKIDSIEYNFYARGGTIKNNLSRFIANSDKLYVIFKFDIFEWDGTFHRLDTQKLNLKLDFEPDGHDINQITDADIVNDTLVTMINRNYFDPSYMDSNINYYKLDKLVGDTLHKVSVPLDSSKLWPFFSVMNDTFVIGLDTGGFVTQDSIFLLHNSIIVSRFAQKNNNVPTSNFPRGSNNNLYFTQNDSNNMNRRIYIWNNNKISRSYLVQDVATKIGGNPFIFQSRDWFVLGTGTQSLYYQEGSQLYQFSPENIRGAVKFNNNVYIISIYRGHTSSSHYISRLKSDICLLKGSVVYDLNSNCKTDTKDQPKSNLITVNQNTMINSNKDGQYAFWGQKDSSYILTPVNDIFTKSYNCNSGTVTHKLIKKDSTYTHNFYLKIDTAVTDLSISLGGSPFVRGFEYTGNIIIENKNANTYQSTNVKLNLANNLSNFKSSFSYTRSSNVVTFTITTIGAFETIHIPYTFKVDTAFQRGDTICLSTEVVVNDSIRTNNYDTLCNTVRGAYDPNIKSSFPEGAITKPVEKIDYTIQFQNLGDYHATNVRVVDTLDTRLPIEYIRVRGTSDPETYSLEVRNNVLIWTFSGINLPDSTSDPEGSKGYISYEAKVKSAFLKQGDQIDNKAEIYFDYEKPVVTNFASVYLKDETNSIFEPSDADNTNLILCYPNPSNGRFTIENKTASPTDIGIYNLYGALILEKNVSANSSIQVSLNGEANGMYVIKNDLGNTMKILKY
jgi:hypothetical protein